MLDIFEFRNNTTYPTIEVLTHPTLKLIYERDKDVHKANAILEYSYLNYLCSYKKSNPFHEYSDIIERKRKIISSMFKKETKEVKKEIYIRYTTDETLLLCEVLLNAIYDDCIPALRFYKSTIESFDKLSEFIRNVDLTETTNSGGLKYNPKMIIDTVKEGKNLNMVLNDLKETVHAEIVNASKTIKNRQIGFFEEVENADL